MHVYDCFIFFNELDLLELRLNELTSVVDTFVIAESTLTFQGKPKPLYFKENYERFSKFHNKIRHVIVDDMPWTLNPWKRESHQRNALKRGFHDADLNSIAIISDADEIPTPESIIELRKRNEFTYFEMNFYVYFLNFQVINGPDLPLIRTYAAPCQQMLNMRDLTKPRNSRGAQNYLKSIKINNVEERILKNAGWHFSWLGTPDNMIKKLGAFSHTEKRVQKWRNEEALKLAIEQKRYFISDADISVRPLAEMPLTVQNNPQYYEKGFLAPIAVMNENS